MALISPKKAAQQYGISTADLGRWRKKGKGPDFYRISSRIVRYGTDDLEAWFRNPNNEELHQFTAEDNT